MPIIVQYQGDGCSLSRKDGAIIWKSFVQLAASRLTILEMVVDCCCPHSRFFQKSCFFISFFCSSLYQAFSHRISSIRILKTNLLALFQSFLATWQSSSHQDLVFLFRNIEVIGILSAAISNNALANMTILPPAPVNRSGDISVINWYWKAYNFLCLEVSLWNYFSVINWYWKAYNFLFLVISFWNYFRYWITRCYLPWLW